MPSISGTNAASTYSDDKKHPNLTGKGRSSTTPSSSTSDKSSLNSGSSETGKQAGTNNMDRGSPGAVSGGASPSKHSANNQGSDNMGGGSSAIFSQGPKQEGNEQDSPPPSKGKDPQGDASTPAMPSMSGTGAASSYSDSAKNKSLTDRSSSSRDRGGGSSKPGITRNPTASNAGSDNMGGGSSAIYSQGPRWGGGQEGLQGDANTPAMPSMSGTHAAATYADRTEKRTLSGRDTSASSASTGTDGGSSRKGADDDVSGNAADYFSGQICDQTSNLALMLYLLPAPPSHPPPPPQNDLFFLMHTSVQLTFPSSSPHNPGPHPQSLPPSPSPPGLAPHDSANASPLPSLLEFFAHSQSWHARLACLVPLDSLLQASHQEGSQVVLPT